MKKEELMIGDWVQEKQTSQGTNEPFKVNSHWALYNASDFDPILITPEILAENGFLKWKHVSGCNEWLYSGFGKEGSNSEFDSISLRETNYNKYHKWCMELHIYGEGSCTFFIDYVHEVQHAFKLCKIDKEITL